VPQTLKPFEKGIMGHNMAHGNPYVPQPILLGTWLKRVSSRQYTCMANDQNNNIVF
jgi:hypothetical protein